MADRHAIVIRIADGQVPEVLFCDCCPGVTVEIRRYSAPIVVPCLRPPELVDHGVERRPTLYEDELGFYQRSFHESDSDDD